MVLDEAREAYDAEIVVELRSDEAGDVEANVDRIEIWLKQWLRTRDEEGGEEEGKEEEINANEEDET